jgi:phosphoglycolate phosphatase
VTGATVIGKISGMKILLFDIDGTLIDSGGAGKLAMDTAFAAEFGIAKRTDAVAYAGRTDIAIITDLLNCYGVDASAEQIRRCLLSYLSHLPHSLTQRSGRTLPGVRQLLEKLSGRSDVLLGLLTGNVEEGARRKLQFFQLDHFFRCGGFADDFYDRNDVARFAHRQAKKHLDEQVESDHEVWVIGDTPHDVTCGRAIGAKVLAVATGSYSVAQLHAAKADHVASDLADLTQILSLWTTGQSDGQIEDVERVAVVIDELA